MLATHPLRQYDAGQRVEVWFDGWDQWLPGTVEQVGFLGGCGCVRVILDGTSEPGVYRLDQIQAMEGLFAQ